MRAYRNDADWSKTMNAYDQMIAKVQQMPTTEIIALINANAAITTPEADIIIEVTLQVLELRLPEPQFIDICDKLSA